MTFEKWRAAVEKHVMDYCGLSLDDLPDWRYYAAWGEGVTPKQAFADVIRNARDF